MLASLQNGVLTLSVAQNTWEVVFELTPFHTNDYGNQLYISKQDC